MTYLPPQIIEETALPYAYGKDLRMQVRMIEEQFRLYCAEAEYFSLKRNVVAQNENMDPIGGPGATNVDPLWGESVDANMSTWTQPHLSAEVTPGNPLKASNPEIYYPPVKIHRRIQRVAREDELKKYGFDRVRTLIAHIPCSFLDAFGITVTAGDKLYWNFEEFTVMQWSPAGYFKNSNVPLYITLNLEHYRPGS